MRQLHELGNLESSQYELRRTHGNFGGIIDESYVYVTRKERHCISLLFIIIVDFQRQKVMSQYIQRRH